MSTDPTPPLAWRLDALFTGILVATLVIAAAVLSSPVVFGVPTFLGASGDALAQALLDSLGVGLCPIFLGMLALLLHYALRGSWLRFSLRVLGWGLLGLVTAGLADFLSSSRWTVSVYGLGGAVGAYLRHMLEHSLRDPLPILVLAATGLLGLTLAMDGLVRQLATVLLNLSHALTLRLTNLAHYLAGWRKARRVQPPLSADPLVADAADVVPLRVILADDAVEPPITRPASFVAVPEVNTIPIHRPEPPKPSLKVHSEEDAAEVDDTPIDYELPEVSLLADPEAFPIEDHEAKLRERAALLEKTFTDFNLAVKVVGIHTGPVITQYEVALDTGLRLNKVTTLADDLALNLGVSAVRIVAPLPGRNTVGIEVPNEHRQVVRLKELIQSSGVKASKFKLPIFLGKDVEGRPLVYDMASMPHLLIAGRTGTGKSVCLNAVILSFLFSRTPEECRLILIDPKKVELSEYGKIPHLMHPVVTDDKKAEAILAWAVDKMEERYELLRRARVRNIHSYNELSWDEIIQRVDPSTEEERQNLPRKMPYIVIVVDEVGDLLMSMKKEVESSIIRLAQKSRAAGIHLILATQKPTVDVITGLIKSNLPARICFQVASRADSAVVLDEKGAEKLLGQGDMLFLQPGTSSIIRAQGAYVDDREIERVVAALAVNEPNYESELLNLKTKDQAGGSLGEKLRERDPLYEQAVEVIIREQRGSTSLLQRALGIGYGKASRFIDFMFEDGIVGAYNGSNARDVLISPEEWAARRATT